ncbi:ATP-binding cassette domain-containing protein [Streptomyces sp. NPDC101234]|uniref:ATP-binding cassette domain-containing protein n=1 Tax=Streptomyces sp. NPDC101234 TaxID=3366138 RepID=UPI0037F4C983
MIPLPPPLLALDGVCKRFGVIEALRDIEPETHAGQALILLGYDGAGKPTLVKVISGVAPADKGSIEREGRTVHIPRPQEARDLGIATVCQDLALCTDLDAVGDLFLGPEIRRFGFLDEVETERGSRQLLERLTRSVPELRGPLVPLSVGRRQTVASARSLLGDPHALLLGEPTAAPELGQTTEVLDLLDRLRHNALGIPLISHNMADVEALANRAAVLRLGRDNGIFDVSTTSREQIVSSITGATDNTPRRPAHREAEW